MTFPRTLATPWLTIHGKNKTPVLGDPIPVLGMKLKRGWSVFWYFLNINLCSATLMESSRRDLLNDMAENMPILKNNQNTCHPRFTPKTGIAFPTTRFCFYCVAFTPTLWATALSEIFVGHENFYLCSIDNLWIGNQRDPRRLSHILGPLYSPFIRR